MNNENIMRVVTQASIVIACCSVFVVACGTEHVDLGQSVVHTIEAASDPVPPPCLCDPDDPKEPKVSTYPCDYATTAPECNDLECWYTHSQGHLARGRCTWQR